MGDDVTSLVQGINAIDTKNKLTRLHKLQIINLRPSSEALLSAIVPQCHQWFTTEQVNQLLLCIKELPEPEPEEDEDDNVDVENDDGDDDIEYDDDGAYDDYDD